MLLKNPINVTTEEWKSSWMYSQSCEIRIKLTGGSQSILDFRYTVVFDR